MQDITFNDMCDAIERIVKRKLTKSELPLVTQLFNCADESAVLLILNHNKHSRKGPGQDASFRIDCVVTDDAAA